MSIGCRAASMARPGWRTIRRTGIRFGPAQASHWRPVAVASRSAFTLIELLVVISIIGILAALLLPVLNKAKGRAAMAVDLNNYHQILIATHNFATDHDDAMPSPGFQNHADCWVYGDSPANPFPYSDGTPAGYNSVYPGQLAAFGRGQLNQYNGEIKTYKCPRETENGAFYQRMFYLSSYVWNGAVSGFNKATTHPYPLSQFKPADILMWESDETSPISLNDGADFPAEGFTRHHGGSQSGDQTQDYRSMVPIGCFDGSARFVSAQYLFAFAGGLPASDSGPANPSTPLPNPLWCNPGDPRGLPGPSH